MTKSTQITLKPYLEANFYVDSDQEDLIKYAQQATQNVFVDKEKAIKLYYAVRDDFAYTPYDIKFAKKDFKASCLLKRGKGHCIAKANLLAASARAVGIPSRLGFGSVINHIATGKIEKVLKTNVLAFHGYAELYLDGRWVKATPAFNQSLCDKLNVPALEWDGKEDAMFQAFDKEGNKYMEYVEYFGEFATIPYDLMLATFKRYYPHLLKELEGDLLFLRSM